MPQNFYELVWIFIIYAFIGWCTEVSYAAVDRGIFVNRGFLNGPYCPIYGCGVVIVVAVLTPLKDNLLICCIVRDKNIITPSGRDTLELNDTVIVVTTHKGLRDISDILKNTGR